MISYARKVRSAGVWQLIEIAAQLIIQFLYIAVMARYLEKSDFGLMAIASSIISFGTIFSEAGMGPALIQRKEISQKHKITALQGGFIFGILIFLMLFLSAPTLSHFYEIPDLKNMLRVIGINVVLISFSSASLAMLHREYMFKKSSLVTTVSIIVGYTSGIVAATQGMGVWSLVLATLIISGTKCIGYFHYAPVKMQIRFYTKEWKELFSFGFGMILLKSLNFFSQHGLNLILGKMFNPSFLGVFERSNKIKNLPSTHIGNILDKILFPAMSQLQNNNDKIINVLKYALGVSYTLLIPVSAFLIVFSKEVVLILLGEKWLDAVIPLQIMFVVLPFSISNRLGDSVIRATGHIYKNVWRKLLYVIILIIFVITGGNYYGLAGAAAGVTLSLFFNYLMTIYLVKQIFKVDVVCLFIHTLSNGLLIALTITTVSVSFKMISIHFDIMSILFFIIYSFVLTGIIALIVIKKPNVLGKYTVYLINNIVNLK